MNVTVSREQGYWRAKCTDKDTCASYTAAGNVAAYWRGPYRSNASAAHTDAITHLIARHDVSPVCSWPDCRQAAAGVVQRRGRMLLRCAEHHVDLRGAR